MILAVHFCSLHREEESIIKDCSPLRVKVAEPSLPHRTVLLTLFRQDA
jgi:hypothetical protein